MSLYSTDLHVLNIHFNLNFIMSETLSDSITLDLR
uniref:Uncharacterized protein n=1 Tax=Anguilla anguilla TaxID=7936 RepID=A0A0E9RS99_ANGAN